MNRQKRFLKAVSLSVAIAFILTTSDIAIAIGAVSLTKSNSSKEGPVNQEYNIKAVDPAKTTIHPGYLHSQANLIRNCLDLKKVLESDKRFGNLARELNAEKADEIITAVSASERDKAISDNISFVKDILDMNKPYQGYDIIIIATTNEDERSIQQIQFEALFGKTVRKPSGATILSVNLKKMSGGGQIIDGLRAYELAHQMHQGLLESSDRVSSTVIETKERELDANGDLNEEVPNLWEKEKVAILLNAGEGKRDSPLTQTENNSRGAIKLGGSIKTAGGDIPITLLNLTYAQNSIFATSNHGSCIDVFYTSQIFIPTKKVIDTASSAKYFTKFAEEINGVQDITDDMINEVGIYEIDQSGNVVRNLPKVISFKSVKIAREEFLKALQKKYKWFYSMGSHRINKKLFNAFREHYQDRLFEENPVIKLALEPPQLIGALLYLAEEADSVKNAKSVDEILSSVSSDTKDKLNALGGAEKDVIEFYLKYRSEFGDDPKTWLGLFDVGGNVPWWRYRSPHSVVNNRLLMISDLAGKKIQISKDGVVGKYAKAAAKDEKEAKVLRNLHGIEHPLANSVFGDVVVDAYGKRSDTDEVIPLNEINKGLTIGGVRIKGSVVLDSALPSGSTVENSFLEGRKGEVHAENSVIEQSVGGILNAENALVYNVINNEELEVQGIAVVDVFRPGITDGRFAKGQTRMRIPFNINGSTEDETKLAGNKFTFKALRDMPNQPANNKKRRAEIEETLAPITLRDNGHYKIQLYNKQGFWLYRLEDNDTGSSFEVMPERGNTLTSLKLKVGDDNKEILYYPEDLTQSGGIPILWPFANRIKDGRFTWSGKERNLRGEEGTKDAAGGHTYHGMVRYKPWKVEAVGRDENGIFFRSSIDTEDHPNILRNFGAAKLTVTYRLKDAELTIESLVKNKNRGTEGIPMSLAFHPWLSISQGKEGRAGVKVKLPASERWETDGELIPLRKGPEKVNGDEKYDLRELKELKDREYDDVFTGLKRDNDGFATATLEDSAAGIHIEVKAGEGFEHMVLFAPKDKPTVSIEPQSSATDAFNLHALNVKAATPIILEHGKPFSARIGISVKQAAFASDNQMRAPPEVVAKKSPGTDALSTQEQVFLERLSVALNDKEKSRLEAIPGTNNEDIIPLVKKVFSPDENVIKSVLKEDREPETFSQRLIYLLEKGKIAFMVDDLSGEDSEDIIKDTALGSGQTINEFDEYLYPRFDRWINPSGVIGFLTPAYYDAENEKVIYEEEYGRLGDEKKKAEKDKKDEAKKSKSEMDRYNPIALIHISENTWKKFKKSAHFKTQLIVHETAENIISSPDAITPHKFATILEMYFASPLGRAMGITDLHRFALEHAAKTKNLSYLNKIVNDYYVERDPSLGSFYEAVWHYANRHGISLDKAYEGELYEVRLRDERFIKKAPGTEVVAPPERSILENRYQGEGKLKEIPASVTSWIKERKIGKIYDGLINLINKKEIVFKVDDLKKDALYERSKLVNAELGILFFVSPGKNESDITEVHISEEIWRRYEDNPQFLSQVLVYTYMQNFLPAMEGIGPHAWAGLSSLYFASKEGIKNEVNDLDLFYLDYAVETSNVKYFYSLLNNYKISLDLQGAFKSAIYSKLLELDNKNADLLIEGIESGEALLAYYEYLFEEKYKGTPVSKRIYKVSEELRKESGKNKNKFLEKNLDKDTNNFLFKYHIGNKLIYIPQNIGSFLEFDVLKILSFYKNDGEKITEKEKSISRFQKRREELRKKKHKQAEIKGINMEIDNELIEIAKISDRPFIDYLYDKLVEKRFKMDNNTGNDDLLVVGIYGPTSTGKTTLVHLLMNRLISRYNDSEGEKVNFISADSYLHPGRNFRYVNKGKGRFTIIKGQSIYNLKGLDRVIRELKAKKSVFTPSDEHAPGYGKGNKGKLREISGGKLRVLIVDFTALGIDKRIAEQVDILVPIVFEDDSVRLKRRIERDTRPKEEGGDRGDTEEQVIGDMVQKQFHEVYDAIRNVIFEHDGIIWRQDTNEIVKLKSDLEFSAHDYADGPLRVAELAGAYEEYAASNLQDTDNIIVDSLVDDENVRMYIPVPKAENDIVKKDYLLARLFNILAVTGPASIELYAPNELQEMLLKVREALFDENKDYKVISGMVEKIYEKPLEIYINDISEAPEDIMTKTKSAKSGNEKQNETAEYLKRIGNIEGVAVGIDIGGTDVKLAVMDKTQAPILLKEHTWDTPPKEFEDGEKFQEVIEDLLMFSLAKVSLDKSNAPSLKGLKERAKKAMDKEYNIKDLKELTGDIKKAGITISKPSSIGISFPDVVVNNEIVGGMTSKTEGMRNSRSPDVYWKDFNENVKPLAAKISKSMAEKFNLKKAIPTAITNDGNVGSLWAAVLSKEGNVMNFASGTSLGGGLVDSKGQIAKRVFELGYLITFIGEEKDLSVFKHNGYDIHGVGQQLLSQDAVFNIALEKGIIKRLPKDKGKAEALEEIQENTEARAREVFDSIGENLALVTATVHYGAVKDLMGQVILFGRVVKGDKGKIVLDRARKNLKEKFVRIGDVKLSRASEMVLKDIQKNSKANMDKGMDSFAQAIGAVYLGNAKRIEALSADSIDLSPLSNWAADTKLAEATAVPDRILGLDPNVTTLRQFLYESTGLDDGERIGLILDASYVTEYLGMRELLRKLADKTISIDSERNIPKFTILVQVKDDAERAIIERMHLPLVEAAANQPLNLLMAAFARRGIRLDHIGVMTKPFEGSEEAFMEYVKELKNVAGSRGYRIVVPKKESEGQTISVHNAIFTLLDMMAGGAARQSVNVIEPMIMPGAEFKEKLEEHKQSILTVRSTI